jgi:hypothetical protein
MKLKNNLKYIATPAKVFMTVLIVLIAVSILQGIIIQIERTFAHAKQRPATTKPKAEFTQEEKRLNRIRNSAREFLPDGTIHLIHKSRRTPGRMDESETEQIYDANDNLLWEGPGNKRPYEYLSWANQSRGFGENFTQQKMKQIQMITPGFSRNIEIPVGSNNKIEQIWRYHSGAQYFKGHDIRGKEIGYIGSTGLADSKTKVKPFGEFRLFTAWCPLDSSNPTLLWQTQKRVYQIDFEKRQVELIFESADSDISMVYLHGWRDFKPDAKEYIDSKKYRPLLLCVTEDGKHHLILREPKQQLSLAAPRSSATATKQEIFVRRFGSDAFPPADIARSRELYDKWLQERRGKPRNFWAELYKVDNQGGLELLNRYDWTRPPPSGPVVKVGDPRPAVQRSVSQFSPPLYDVAARLLGRKFWLWAFDSRNRGDFFSSLARMIMEIRPYGGVLNRVLSALMMVFVFLHGWPRRTSWAGFVFWLVFVGTFNMAGLLTYLALNHTLVIKCSACGKRRGLDRVDCVRCKAELPAPERGKLDLIFST